MKKRRGPIIFLSAVSLALIAGVVYASLLPFASVDVTRGAGDAYALVLSKNKGGKPTLTSGAGTSQLNTENGNPIAFSFSGCADYDNGLVTLNADGYLQNTIRLSAIKGVTANFTGTGTLDLYTSFDGTSFVKKGSLTSGTAISAFAYNPNYVKLLASSGAVSLTLLRFDYECKNTQFADFSSFKGLYKGDLTDTINGTEHTKEKAIISVDDVSGKVSFFAYDVKTDAWSSLDLYGLPDSDTYNADFTLAADRNASDPAVVYTANFGTPVTIEASFKDADGVYQNYSFSGSKYVPATSVSIAEGSSGSISVGDTFTLNATVLPWGTTDTISWTTSDASIVKFANTTKTGSKVSFKGVAAGQATITATAGTVSASYAVTINAAVSFPDALKNTTWTGSDGTTDITVAFASDGQITFADSIYNISDETAPVKSIAKTGTIYSISYEDTGDLTSVSFSFDSEADTLAFTGDSSDGYTSLPEVTLSKIRLISLGERGA